VATLYISYGLVSPHLENPSDFPKPVFIWRGSCRDTPQLIYKHVAINLNQMNKALKIAFLSFVFSSCTDVNQIENTVAKLEGLRAENDSLKKVIAGINNKYVFDSISFRNIYGKDNKYERNADFEMELLVVGYNPKKSYFVKYDSIVNGQKINPDTLMQTNGGFKYKTKLTEKENEIQIYMDIDNEYGQGKEAVLYDLIRTKN